MKAKITQFLTYINGKLTRSSDGTATKYATVQKGRVRYYNGPTTVQQSPGAIESTFGSINLIRSSTGVTPVVLRERNPNKISWEGPLVIPENASATEADGSIVIRNRNFKSTDLNGSPAIYIRSPRKVLIENCNVFGYGGPGSGAGIIASDNWGGQLTVRNTIGFSGNPGVAGKYGGRFVTMSYFFSCTIENCEAYGTLGIGLSEWKGDNTNPSHTIKIRYNKINELDGRISNGPGVYKTGNTWNNGANSDFVIANLVQFDKVANIKNVDISYNESVSTAGNSRYEDAFSFYESGGAPDSYMKIHHNLIRGAYVYDAWYQPGVSTSYGNNMPVGTPGRGDDRGYGHSGGLGLLGDGLNKTAPRVPGYLEMYENVALDSTNYGLGIAAGKNMILRNNRIFRSGYAHNLPGVRLSWKHLPIQIQDYYGGYDPQWWGGHLIKDNVVGYTVVAANGTKTSEPIWVDTTQVPASSYTMTNNVDMGVVSPLFVDNEETVWRQAMAAANVRIGAV